MHRLTASTFTLPDENPYTFCHIYGCLDDMGNIRSANDKTQHVDTEWTDEDACLLYFQHNRKTTKRTMENDPDHKQTNKMDKGIFHLFF